MCPGVPAGVPAGALAGAHGHPVGGACPIVTDTAEPRPTPVPAGGFWVITPRGLQYLAVTLVTVPRTRAAACRAWEAWAWVSPVRSGTVGAGCGTWTAKPDASPAATWVAPVRPVTRTGPVTGAVLPVPSSPWLLSPQASTVPSDTSATMCSSP